MFTADARYEEHNLGVFEGQPAIESFIVTTMKEYPSMTLWIEWADIEDDLIAFYIWNNLPDPTGTGKRFGFPNTTFLAVRRRRQVQLRGRLLQPRRRRACVRRVAAGRRPQAHAAGPLASRASRAGRRRCPSRPSRARRWRPSSCSTASAARSPSRPATGISGPTSSRPTPSTASTTSATSTARTRSATWIKGVMQPFPTMEFPVKWSVINGNRVSALIPNILPPPDGDDGYYGFDVNTILHYAGNGKWSYEEDVYSPREAEAGRAAAGSPPAARSADRVVA